MILLTAFALAAPAFAADTKGIEEMIKGFADGWNKHDAKAMTMTWTKDGDLINPMGRYAKGHADIEKLFTEEHGTMMKASTLAFDNLQARALKGDQAFIDVDM